LEELLHDKHEMGRWTGQKFRLKEDRFLFVITAYRPCKRNRSDDSPNTSYQQQYVQLREMGNANPNPRQSFINDMIEHVQQDWKVHNEDFLLILMDANEVMHEEQHGISRLVEKLKIIDLVESHHHKKCDIGTHISGKRKIDVAFGTPNLLPFIHKCGYGSFYQDSMSDHRPIFIDIKDDIIDRHLNTYSIPTRQIGSNCSQKQINKYKAYIITQFKHHRIQERSQLLDEQAILFPGDTKHYTLLTTLDKQVTEIVLEAERQCGHTQPNHTTEVQTASQVVKYWRLKLKQVNFKINVTPLLEKITKDLPAIERALIKAQKDNAKGALNTAMASLKIIMKDSKPLQSRLLQNHPSFKSMQDNWKEIGIQMKDNSRSGITHLEVPDKDHLGNPTNDPDIAHTWKKIYDPEEIEDCILQRNIKHFGQAQGSPFTQPMITEQIGYTGTGNLDPNRKYGTQGTQAIIQLLSNKKELKTIDDIITINDMKRGFQAWRESTSTSPSGRHLGHYKVLLSRNIDDVKLAPNELSSSDTILQVYTNIVMAALKSGTSLTRWQNSTTAMIEKIPGTPRINKLRVIHLYEADYNLLLQILWGRRLVWHAHSQHRINEGQAGARPGRRCIDVVIHKEMKYMYSSITRSDMATMDNDAKSCYDRIICNLAMVISKYFGMSTRACQTQAATLQNMQFRLRTALGDSKKSYQHSASTPVHGSGQGSCASPCLWLLISSILMECLEIEGNGLKIQDVNTHTVMKQWIEGFVDDTSLFTNLPTYTSNIIDLTSAITDDLQIWAGLLEASGGKLELSKCFYYILSWKFNTEGDPAPTSIADQRELTDQISIFDSTTSSTTLIPQKEVTEAHKTLGVWKSPIGDESKQKKILQEKSDHFATKIASAQLTRYQARLAYNAMYSPAMTYCLPACNINAADLEKIQRKAVEYTLPALGFQRCLPRAIVYGPREYGGINLNHLYTEQCMLKIESLICHIRAQSQLGKIMQINLNWLQLHSGNKTSILEHWDTLSYLPTNWFLHLRDFLIKIKGTISIKNLWQPQTPRANDAYLMDVFRKLPYKTSELRLINNWRLFFKVNTISDLCNAQGTQVDVQYRQYTEILEHNKHQRATRLNWPRQSRPGKLGYKYWRDALTKGLFMAPNGKLRKPLGHWQIYAEQQDSTWHHYFSSSTNQLYTRNGSHFDVYPMCKAGRNHNECSLESITSIATLPMCANPADVFHTPTVWVVHHVNGLTPPSRLHEPSFSSYIQIMPDWEQQILHRWSSQADATKISTAFHSDDPLQIGIDGGLKLGIGTFGVVMQHSSVELMRIHGKVPGIDRLFTPYRSEAYSLLAALVLLRRCSQFHKLRNNQHKCVEIYCDNISLIRRVQDLHQVSTKIGYYNSSDIDLELQIQQELKDLDTQNFDIHVLYIKGHQDTNAEQSPPIAAQLNIIADELAHTAFHAQQKATYFDFPANLVNLVINSEEITAKVKTCIRTASTSHDLHVHMMRVFGWDKKTLDTIWWSAHDLAIQSLPHNDRIKIQKFIHDVWPSNSREARYRDTIKDQCRACEQEGETEDHILRCPCHLRKAIRMNMTAELRAFMTKTNTDSNVSRALLLGIHAWIHGLQAPDPSKYLHNASFELIQAFHQQTKIGWRHVLKGRLVSAWGSFINHQHTNNEPIEATGFKSKPYMNHAEKWGTNVISIIWRNVLQIWDARNKDEHGANIEEESSRKKTKLMLEIQDLRDQINATNQKKKDMTSLPTPKETNSTVSTLKTWIRHIKILLKIHKKENTQAEQPSNLPFDRGPQDRMQHKTKPKNRVSRRSVQETVSTPRGI
jgi:hypothetical protein